MQREQFGGECIENAGRIPPAAASPTMRQLDLGRQH